MAATTVCCCAQVRQQKFELCAGLHANQAQANDIRTGDKPWDQLHRSISWRDGKGECRLEIEAPASLGSAVEALTSGATKIVQPTVAVP